MKYRVESENTTKYIELHDCQCARFSFGGGRAVMEMEWIEVLAEHPENPYEKAHQSGEGEIVFEGAVMISDKTELGRDGFGELSALSVEGIEILSFFESEIDGRYRYACIGGLCENEYVTLELLFERSLVKWNELNGESWFEAREFERKKPEHTVPEILKTLSWNNPEEVQEKGRRLASKIGYLGFLFQPQVGGESKSLWENCAMVLSERDDGKLSPWLLQCFLWLRDMNWPGAEIIRKRLSLFKDSGRLNSETAKAERIARIVGDTEWLEELENMWR